MGPHLNGAEPSQPTPFPKFLEESGDPPMKGHKTLANRSLDDPQDRFAVASPSRSLRYYHRTSTIPLTGPLHLLVGNGDGNIYELARAVLHFKFKLGR